MQVLRVLAGLTPLLAAVLATPAFSLAESAPSTNETRMLLARQGAFDTSCEIGDGRVSVVDGSGNRPAAFTILWDAVENELCTAQGCNFNEEKCIPASAALTICISARGDFLPSNRLDIIRGEKSLPLQQASLSARSPFTHTIRWQALAGRSIAQ